MQSQALSPQDYIDSLPDERKEPMHELRETISKNLPRGFTETINYGMIGYVVPHAIFPAGYHCDPKQPLPFINIASQKNFIALYHMGLYANQELLDWFVGEYPKHCKTKLDIGKSCIRFKRPEHIPYALLGELAAKMSVEDWIGLYEGNMRK